MNVELISVGTELLLGNIINTNAAYLAEQCAYLGLSCYHQSVVGDNEERLMDSLVTAYNRSDIVILSGGLGPTRDDLTKETAAKVLGKELFMEEHSRVRIMTYFENKNMEITDNNWKQAMVPKGAMVIDNENGTAPGIIMEAKGKHIILLPGPPNELVPMFEADIKEYLRKIGSKTIYSQTVKVCGIGESEVDAAIADLLEEQTNPTLAPYAKSGEVHLRVTAAAENEKEAKKLAKPLIKELKVRFGEDVYSTEETVALENAVVDLLAANNLTVSTVESCTGGLLAGRLINVPGVSKVFKTGHITYSNKAKRKVLGIKKNIIDKYGAVSEIVAKEMAKCISIKTKADVGVSITGIAGPEGGTDAKPVGLVYIGCSVCGKIIVKEYHFNGNRTKIRETTVSEALILMRKCILEYFKDITSENNK